MSRISPLLTFMLVMLFAFDCAAQPPKERPGRKRAGGAENSDPNNNTAVDRLRRGRPNGRAADDQATNQDQNNGQGKGQGQNPGRGNVNPAALVKRLLPQFDKDGDQKLDAGELTALLTAMRERGGGMGPRQAGQQDGQRPGQSARMRRPGDSDRPNDRPGGRNRRGGNESLGESGGDKPKRPTAQEN